LSGQCVSKTSCDKCHSSDAKQIFVEDGKYTAWCFSCHSYDSNPYGDSPPTSLPPKITKTPEQIEQELAEIATLSACDLPDRALRKETLDYFGIKIAVSEEDGNTPTAHFYPYYKGGKLSGYKGRVIETKQFFSVGHVKADCDFFGWEQAIASGAKKLIITEGELDAPSIFQALKDKNRNTQYSDRNPAVVSLINGSGSAGKALADKAAEIRAHFSEVVLAFDMDSPGKKATEAAILSYPSAQSVALPDEDPNECLKSGKSLALANAILFKAEKPKNSRLIWAESLYASAKEPAKWGLSWPWPGITDMTRGLRTGETIYIGAGVKMGKSTVVDALATHLMLEHGLKVMLAKPEEANKKTIKKLVGYATGHIFTDPKVEFDGEAYDRGAELLGNKFCVINIYQHLGWAGLKQDITAAVAEGCKAIFIDPLTNLTAGVPAGEANTQLQAIAQEYSAMSMDMDFIGFMFCHLLAPESGPTHERGGAVLSRQFAGSRAMAQKCNYMLGLEGDKDPDLPIEQRNMRSLVLLEDREFGEVGRVPLYYDFKTGLLKEVPPQ
jgi:twinkle protein